MKNKRNECNIIQDILPLYIDGIASEDSAAYIEEHITKCEKCKKMLDDMKTPTEVEKVCEKDVVKDISPLKAMKKQMRLKNIKTAFVSAVAAILTLCILVITILTSIVQSELFYTNETKPKTLSDKMELVSCIDYFNLWHNRTVEFEVGDSVNTSLVDKYTKPALEYLINENKDNDNYKACFVTTIGWTNFYYEVFVNGNVARVTMDVTSDDYNRDGKYELEKQYEWYVFLEDDEITSYAKQDEQWVKTTRKASVVDHVMFDLEAMLNEFEAVGLPTYEECDELEKNLITFTTKDDYNGVSYPGIQFDADTHDITFLSYGGLLLNKSSDIVADLCKKDAFLNEICDTYQSGLSLEMRIDEISFSDHGKVEVILPEEAKAAAEVESFNFMTKGISERLDKFWEWCG